MEGDEDAFALLMAFRAFRGHVDPVAPARDIPAPLHAPATGGGGSRDAPARALGAPGYCGIIGALERRVAICPHVHYALI